MNTYNEQTSKLEKLKEQRSELEKMVNINLFLFSCRHTPRLNGK
jgi:hypothetical protein